MIIEILWNQSPAYARPKYLSGTKSEVLTQTNIEINYYS